jgi:hypothetical protein
VRYKHPASSNKMPPVSFPLIIRIRNKFLIENRPSIRKLVDDGPARHDTTRHDTTRQVKESGDEDDDEQ